MSKEKKKIFLVMFVVLFFLVGLVIYSDTVSGRNKLPGGVFVSL